MMMITSLTILLTLVHFGFAAPGAEAQMEPAIPHEAGQILKERFRSWQLAVPAEEVSQYYASRHPGRHPSITSGDYDGDGLTDYAVLLSRKTNSDDRIVVALLARPTGWDAIYAGDGADSVSTASKGSKGFDFTTQSYFTYRSDAIFTYVWEKAGRSLVYSKGRFQRITTSD